MQVQRFTHGCLAPSVAKVDLNDLSFQTEGQERERLGQDERFVVLAAREARRGRADDLRAAIDDLMTYARSAPGFDRVDVLAPFGEPAIFLHYEVWDTKAAHDEFDSGPIHQRFAKQSANLVAHHNIPVHFRLLTSYRPTQQSGEEK
jgi:quinol monooxygenase YgiN